MTGAQRTLMPLLDAPPGKGKTAIVWMFVLLPTPLVLAGIFFLAGAPSWLDISLAVLWYYITCTGIGVGYHRLFTHNSFKARPGLRIALAICGLMAGQGPVILWVADHRRHHAFSDREGDPHSPWLFGTRPRDIARGFWHAHVGWLLKRERTNAQRFAPDLLEDDTLARLDSFFWLFMVLTFAGPAAMGGLLTWSWQGALSAFFWAGLARFAFLHHVTWSINSICHMIGERPFAARDKAGNVWWLAILSGGESWHNLHHADPTCARHGVKKGQIDSNARLIWLFEKLGLATKVRWPTERRLARITVGG